jgi:NADH-quinone oxidoreductase subunit C
MDATALVTLLQEAVPGAVLEPVASSDLQTTIYVSRDEVPAVALVLRDRPELRFALLAELTAVDFWPREPRFEVVYILVSLEHRRRVRLKVRLHGSDAHLATVSDIWPSANWFEREVWDLFGIVFDGHPDPRRLLMPEDWEGYPLRKDYPVQITMKPRTTEPMQVTEQEFRASLLKDRMSRS